MNDQNKIYFPTQHYKIADMLEQPLYGGEGRYGRAAGEARPQEEWQGREVQDTAKHQDIKLVFKQIERQLEKSILDSIGGWMDIMEENKAEQQNEKAKFSGLTGPVAPGGLQWRRFVQSGL